MSFVSEYNLGRDESTTYFLASLACSLRVPAFWPVTPKWEERQQVGRIVSADIGCSTA